MTRLIALMRRSLSSPCSVCGQPMPLAASFCPECGLVPSLRRDRRRRPRAAIVLVAAGIAVVAAVAVVGLTRQAEAPAPVVFRAAEQLREEKRAWTADQRVETAEESRTYRTARTSTVWALRGMIAVCALAALLLCARALQSRRPRPHGWAESHEPAGGVRRPLVGRLGWAGTAVFFATTVALAAVVANQSRDPEPLPAGPPLGAHIDELRREVSALKERLRVADARLGSTESRASAADAAARGASAEARRALTAVDRFQRAAPAMPPRRADRPPRATSDVVDRDDTPAATAPSRVDSMAKRPAVVAPALSASERTPRAESSAPAEPSALVAVPSPQSTPPPPVSATADAPTTPRVLLEKTAARDEPSESSHQVDVSVAEKMRDDWKRIKEGAKSAAKDFMGALRALRDKF